MLFVTKDRPMTMATTAGSLPPSRRYDCVLAAAAISFSLIGGAASAEEPHPHLSQEVHTHVPLEIDPALDLRAVVEAALAAHPQSGELVAREREAEAWAARGRQWLAAAPALYFSYLNDAPRDDWGQRQYDLGLDLPLWRVGQRDAVRSLASSANRESGAAAAALRLEVAGLLRGALWDIAAAVSAMAAARDAEGLARELVRVVERLNSSGDLPRADLLLARATLLEREQAVVAAEANLLDAERTYRSLTRLEARPASFAEAPSELHELAVAHPFIALAEAGVLRAEANRELVDREVRGPLTLSIGPHREIDPFTTVPRDSVVVALNMPVGGKSYGGTQTAQARREAAAAVAERGELLRRLDLDLHEAEHTLLVLERSTLLADERNSLTAQQLSMAQTAFAQGEIELRELIRVQESTLAARRDVERLAIERERTIAALNQALGVTP